MPTAPFRDAVELSPAELATLQRYRFDAAAFAHLRAELAAGRFGPERNRVDDPIAATEAQDIEPWPAAASELEQIGQVALDRGEVAVAILNGGMATRFGGRVKGVVEVLHGQSFLALKLRDVARNRRVPVFLMNSFATAADTQKHLEAHQYFGLEPTRVHAVHQTISLRLREDGSLYRSASGEVSYYAPGHGDLLAAVAASPALQNFRAAGGKYICISNVDNLGATVAAKVLGVHIRGGKKMTTEVAQRLAGDTGGAPVRRRGRVEVLEGFRFPPEFDTETLAAFNTNTFVVDVDALCKTYPFTWFRADKKVGADAVVQFERLLGELTAFVPSTYLMVPRDGDEGRFLPVKTPQDIDTVRPALALRFAPASA